MSEPRKVRIVAKDEEPDRNEDQTPGGSPVNEECLSAPDGIENASASPDDDAKALSAKLEAKDKELNETYDRLLRLTAEFENYKKRAAREMEEFRKFANQALLKEMLSVADHIELAVQAAATSGSEKGLLEGLTLTQKELLRVLEKFNVKPIEAVGQPFNPEFHEAILREPSDRLPENAVLREMQKGYMIGGRLLRPSLVVVAAPSQTNTLPDSGEGMEPI